MRLADCLSQGVAAAGISSAAAVTGQDGVLSGRQAGGGVGCYSRAVQRDRACGHAVYAEDHVPGWDAGAGSRRNRGRKGDRTALNLRIGARDQRGCGADGRGYGADRKLGDIGVAIAAGVCGLIGTRCRGKVLRCRLASNIYAAEAVQGNAVAKILDIAAKVGRVEQLRSAWVELGDKCVDANGRAIARRVIYGLVSARCGGEIRRNRIASYIGVAQAVHGDRVAGISRAALSAATAAGLGRYAAAAQESRIHQGAAGRVHLGDKSGCSLVCPSKVGRLISVPRHRIILRVRIARHVSVARTVQGNGLPEIVGGATHESRVHQLRAGWVELGHKHVVSHGL